MCVALWLNRTVTSCVSILSLIRSSLCMSRLTLGWNTFKLALYVSNVLSAPIGTIGGTNNQMTITMRNYIHLCKRSKKSFGDLNGSKIKLATRNICPILSNMFKWYIYIYIYIYMCVCVCVCVCVSERERERDREREREGGRGVFKKYRHLIYLYQGRMNKELNIDFLFKIVPWYSAQLFQRVRYLSNPI